MIQLTSMTAEEYDAFYEHIILDYADGLVRAGNAHPDVAVQLSQQQCQPEIPETDSIEELVRFWDMHDLTDSEDQLEPVTEPVFERKTTTIRNS